MTAVLKPRHMINHSVVLTVEQQEYIIQSIVIGVSIEQICKQLAIPVHHIYDYAFKDPIFDKRMEKSRVYNAHLLVDRLMHITDDCETIADSAIARVWSDNAKWIAGKMEPTKYGERLDINVTHLDLSAVLLAAEDRVLPILQSKQALIKDVDIVEELPEELIDLI